MPENILQHAAPITTARPPVVDKIAAAVSGVLTAILIGLRAFGVEPPDIPPDVVLLFATSIATVVASIRAHREAGAQASAAQTVTALVAELVAAREQLSAAAVTNPTGEAEPPRVEAVPLPRPGGEAVKRRGG